LILESPQLKARRVDIDPATNQFEAWSFRPSLRVFERGAQMSGSCVVYHPQREPTTGEAGQ
jgi:hypothetical protein